MIGSLAGALVGSFKCQIELICIHILTAKKLKCPNRFVFWIACCPQDNWQRKDCLLRASAGPRHAWKRSPRSNGPSKHCKGSALLRDWQTLLHLHGVRGLWKRLLVEESARQKQACQRRKDGYLGARCANGHLLHALARGHSHRHQNRQYSYLWIG